MTRIIIILDWKKNILIDGYYNIPK